MLASSRCVSCRYWQVNGLYPTVALRACLHPDMQAYYPPPAEDLPPTAAIIVDWEAGGMLYTGPAFGCVRWEGHMEAAADG